MDGGGRRNRLRGAAAAFSSNWRNPDLRRAQSSFLGAWTAEWAFTVALGIVAYRDGGAVAVGLVGLLRMVPSAIFAPLLSPIADRGRRERVLILVSVVRGSATAAAALVVAMAWPAGVVYALAVVSTIAATLYRPAHSALLPSLCRTGYELASANMVRGLLDSAATLIGPLVAAVLLEFTGVELVFVVAAAASFIAAGLLVGLRYEAPPRPAAPPRHNLAAEAVEGVRAATSNRDIMLILLLGTGEPGAGALMTAVGVGAVLGSLGASLLVGTGRLGGWFAVGIGLWGLPIALIGIFPQQALALVLLSLVGVGNALVDIAGFTLVARLAPDQVLARIFGMLESLVAVAVGIGAILASTLIEWLGLQPALIAIGLVCPILAAASWWRLRALDRAVGDLDAHVELLQQVPMLHTLPLPSIEQLARGLEPVTVPAGTPVFGQGEVGNRFYVIEDGAAQVVGDGRVVATLGPGEGFGEIALLRRTRRTASVVATKDLRMQTLTCDRFIPVVLGYTPSAQQAEHDMDDRLGQWKKTEPGPSTGEAPA